MQYTERQNHILKEAINLFTEKGYKGTSMRDLASKLDIKAASLYAHIQSKEDVLEWICFGIANDFFQKFNRIKESNLPPIELLNLFIDNHLSVVIKNPQVTHIYSNEWKHLGARLNEFINLRRSYQNEVQDFLISIYTQLNWELNSPKFTTKFLLHTLNNSYFWFNNVAVSSINITEEIKQKILFGLIGK